MKVPGSGLRIDDPAWPLLQALISYWGVTDNNGAGAGTTIRCGALATEPSYANHALKILSGPAAGQTRDITTHPAGTDTLTVSVAFSNVTGAAQQIVAGTLFVILSKTPAIAEVAAIEAKLDLATPGAAFSYLAAGGEQTVFTFIPTKDTILHTIWLDLFTLTQNSTIRLKHQIDGVTYRTFETFNWTTGMDDGVYFRDIAVMAARPIQVTMQETADEGAPRAIPYYYVYEERA